VPFSRLGQKMIIQNRRMALSDRSVNAAVSNELQVIADHDIARFTPRAEQPRLETWVVGQNPRRMILSRSLRDEKDTAE
jgi:hypothetical protein